MYSKEKIEEELEKLLDECMENVNQEGAIKSLTYNEKDETCTVVLSTHIVEEDDFIGFQVY